MNYKVANEALLSVGGDSSATESWDEELSPSTVHPLGNNAWKTIMKSK